MKKYAVRIAIAVVVLVLAAVSAVVQGQSNAPPQVSILFPDSSTVIRGGICIKLKAEATSPNGSITQVQFFAQNTNPIGFVTNSPFSKVWQIGQGITNQYVDLLVLTAVATDSAGITATSAPVTLPFDLQPPQTVLKMVSPSNGAVFATSDTILLSAELLSSECDTGPEEFFVGTNSVGIVNTNGLNEAFTDATPLFSMSMSNLSEGDYEMSVRYLGRDGAYGSAHVRVVRLAAISPRLVSGKNLAFDVVTSFSGRANVIEISNDLFNWTPISTNTPAASRFTFVDPTPIPGSGRFYRVIIPPN